MAAHDREQARPEQDAGKVAQPAGASKSSRPGDDDDPQRINLSIDQRADDSGGARNEGVAEDRPRDGTA